MRKLLYLLLLFSHVHYVFGTQQELIKNLKEARQLLETWSLSLSNQESEFLEKNKFLREIEENLNLREKKLQKKELTLSEREAIIVETEQDLTKTKILMQNLEQSLTKALNLQKKQNDVLRVSLIISISLGVATTAFLTFLVIQK